jgi:hypothetical protein
MISIVEQLERAADQLDEHGQRCNGTRVDPTPLLEFIDQCTALLTVCRVCLAYYDDPVRNKPAEPWVERQNGGSRHSRPWESYTSEVWLARRHRLVGLFVRTYGTLSLPYDTLESSNDTNTGGRIRFRPSELLYIVICHVMLCAYAKMNADQKRALCGDGADQQSSSPQSLEYCSVHMLQIHSEPVGAYSVQQLRSTQDWLCSRINELPFDNELVAFLLQLEVRAAMLLVKVDTALVHDVEELRQSLNEREYKASDLLLTTLTIVSAALYTRVLTAYCLPSAPVERRIRVPPDLSTRMRRWFVQQAQNHRMRLTSEWIREMYIECSLWPAERELYQLRNPRDVTSVTLTILKTQRDNAVRQQQQPQHPQQSTYASHPYMKSSRPVEYRHLIENARKPCATIIEEELRATPGTPESRLLQLALVEMTALDVKRNWMGIDLFRYCTLARDLELQLESVLHDDFDTPRVAQIFNHFQLLYRGQIHWFDSFIEAWCAWFMLISQTRGDLSPFYLTPRICIKDTARQIFGDAMFPNEERQLQSSSAPAAQTAAGKLPVSLYEF